MKLMQVEVPEKTAVEMNALVKNGWFIDEAEIVRQALLEFITHHRFTLLEQFQLEDINWALKQKRAEA